MKETVKVNLGGQLFDLDSDAFEKLKKYLDSLKRKFSASPKEAEEIVEDIEIRIAELLAAKISDKKQVISLADVEEVISQLGTAEEMDEPESEETEQPSSKSKGQSRSKKRFYRDTENSVLGGVCSGLSAYFDIDPIWIRLIFVILFFAPFAGLLIYIILWIVIPQARTTAQKLEMRGKPVNISNIEESVKDEFDKVKSKIKDIPNSKGYQNIESGLSEFFRVLGNALLVFIKVLGILIGVFLLLAFIFAIIGIVAGGALFFPGEWFNTWDWPHFGFWPHFTITGICLFLVIIIPIIAVLVKIIKLLFGIKTQNQVAAGLGATIWVLALITFIVMLASDIDRGTFRNTEHTKYSFDISTNEPLFIGVDVQDNSNHQFEHYQFFDREFVWDEWNNDYLAHPKVIIKRSKSNQIKLDIYKTYLHFQVGKKPSKWEKLADYEWRMSDSQLILDEFYIVDDDYIWRIPKVRVVITVPEGLDITCDESAINILGINCNASSDIFDSFENEEVIDNTDSKVEVLKELEESAE